MDPQKYLNRLETKNRELSVKNSEYKDLLIDRAEAEKNHSIALAQKTLELKAEHPVTIIKKLADGDKNVADLKFRADVAEAMVKACLQSMKNIHAVMDGTRSTLTWLRSEKGQN